MDDSRLRHIKNAKAIAFDFNGSIAKLCYLSEVLTNLTALDATVSISPKKALFINAFQFHLGAIEEVVRDLVENATELQRPLVVPVVGCPNSGPQEQLVAEMLDAKIQLIDTMAAQVRGAEFLLRNILDESFRYLEDSAGTPKYKFDTIDPTKPYLIVNVGTGVSIVRVEGNGQFSRPRGNSIGSGTFLALAELLFGVTDLDTMIELGSKGDNNNFDKLVGDIYGEKNCSRLGLPEQLIAGSFGKMGNPLYVEELKSRGTFTSDGLRSLIMMIAVNVSQLVSLTALEPNANGPIDRIFFDGALIRNYPLIMKCLVESMSFWTKEHSTHFFRHEGYASVLGAFMIGHKESTFGVHEMGKGISSLSWREHIAGCSAFGDFVPRSKINDNFDFTSLEFIGVDTTLDRFPLLSQKIVYTPDTIDFENEPEYQHIWLESLSSSIGKVVQRAIRSQGETEDAKMRAEKFHQQFKVTMERLHHTPHSNGSCNARDILEIREQYLVDCGFDDIYVKQKHDENMRSLVELPMVLNELDHAGEESLKASCYGLLAGNVFDWGAKEIVKMLQEESGVSFHNALNLLRPRPWLIDNLDEWLENVNNELYKSAIIFCDNAGADIILGVVPFSRELLKRGVKIIVAVNQMPALNDITYKEVVVLCEEIAKIDEIFGIAWRTGDLVVEHSGQASPCLDLRQVNVKLNELVISRKVDLIVIEGMGRALHTNFYAQFSVDCLKVAVIKTSWLAKHMGGQLFDSVFKLDKSRAHSVEENGN